MKRFLENKRFINIYVLILTILLLANLFPMQAYASVQKTDIILGQTVESRGLKAANCPSVEAKYVYLVDDSGTVYFERDAQAETQIASITKIMTAIVALESTSLDFDIKVSSYAARVGESSAGLIAGDELQLSDALKGLMVPSGNDAAIAIGESIGKTFYQQATSQGQTLVRRDGKELIDDNNSSYLDAFVIKMNEKAEELGCTNTIFTNPHGLDFGEFTGDLKSTAEEVSKIASYAMQIPYFKEIVTLESADLQVLRNGVETTVRVESTDKLLGTYEGACGIKTGNTSLAGPCFAGACERDNLMLYAIVLDSTSDYQRFIDTEALYNWVYDNYIAYSVANSDVTTQMYMDGEWKDVPVVADVALDSWIDKTVPATFENPDKTIDIFTLNGNVSQEMVFDQITGGVKAGQVIGKCYFYQRNELIGEENIVATEDVDGPNILESCTIFINKLFNQFTGSPTSADSKVINEMNLVINKAS